MLQKIRYLLPVVLLTIIIASLTLLPVTGSKLDIERNYLPYIVNPADTPTPTHTPSPEPTVTNTPIPTDTPTPLPTDPPSPVPSGDVRITNIHYDGAGSQEPDEYVQIRNYDSRPVQLNGWTLRDIANHTFTFPSFVMEPDQVCRVYTNQYHAEWCGFSYGNGSAIWNNGGDCAYLRDSGGGLVDDYCY